MKQINDAVPDLLDRQPDVSAGLRTVVMKALRKDPAKRYATAADLEAELAGVEPVPTPREGTVRRQTAEDALMAQLESALGAVILPTPPQPPRRPIPSDGASRPVAHPTPVPTVPVVVAPAAPSRPPILLLVSAVGADRAAWKAGLGGGACRILEAGSGTEALEALVREPADLVVMDVSLPGMDGFDVTRVIKSQPNLAALPVVLAADRLERSRYAFGIQSGANEVLQKPIDPAHLKGKVGQLLRHRGFPLPGWAPDGPAVGPPNA
jgi:CheY-like chemotaxis protein